MTKSRYLLKSLLLLNVYLLSSDPIVNNNGLWRNIQKVTENAVVKIFSVSKKFNWFAPYVTPTSYFSTGTGFFINEADIITNSHVVDNASAVFISIPFLGKERLQAIVLSICPKHDIALLRLTDESLAIIKRELGSVKYVVLGDSDTAYRFDEVLALGYPLDSEDFKSTAGVISGRSSVQFDNFSGYCIQIDAPINPGNSGGPLLNVDGEVIGIVNAYRGNAQNYNFAIPINVLKTILTDLYNQPLLHINNMGIIWSYGTDEIRKYYSNPLTYGCVVCEVLEHSNAFVAGLQPGDMIYEVDGFVIDSYGEIESENGRMCFSHYIAELPAETEVQLLLYRNGIAVNKTVCLNKDNSVSIPFKYPTYQSIDYEIFGGMIVMELSVNYIKESLQYRPALQRYITKKYAHNSRLVVANILDESKLNMQMRTIRWGDTINEINGEEVSTLEEFRTALLKSVETGKIVIKTTDELNLNTDNILTVLSLSDSCKEAVALAHIYNYLLSPTVIELINKTDSTLLME